MKIAYLAWGSLVWDPRGLPVRGHWFENGPMLPVEFCRQSQGGRITLVLVPKVPLVQVLWGLSAETELVKAVKALCEREGDIPDHLVGRWSVRGYEKPAYPQIAEWGLRMSLDAVVWTNLPPKFNDIKGKVPSKEQVVRYLDSRVAGERDAAENYVRKAPRQIDTDYRHYIETKLGWTPFS